MHAMDWPGHIAKLFNKMERNGEEEWIEQAAERHADEVVQPDEDFTVSADVVTSICGETNVTCAQIVEQASTEAQEAETDNDRRFWEYVRLAAAICSWDERIEWAMLYTETLRNRCQGW